MNINAKIIYNSFSPQIEYEGYEYPRVEYRQNRVIDVSNAVERGSISGIYESIDEQELTKIEASDITIKLDLAKDAQTEDNDEYDSISTYNRVYGFLYDRYIDSENDGILELSLRITTDGIAKNFRGIIDKKSLKFDEEKKEIKMTVFSGLKTCDLFGSEAVKSLNYGEWPLDLSVEDAFYETVDRNWGLPDAEPTIAVGDLELPEINEYLFSSLGLHDPDGLLSGHLFSDFGLSSNDIYIIEDLSDTSGSLNYKLYQAEIDNEDGKIIIEDEITDFTNYVQIMQYANHFPIDVYAADIASGAISDYIDDTYNNDIGNLILNDRTDTAIASLFSYNTQEYIESFSDSGDYKLQKFLLTDFDSDGLPNYDTPTTKPAEDLGYWFAENEMTINERNEEIIFLGPHSIYALETDFSDTDNITDDPGMDNIYIFGSTTNPYDSCVYFSNKEILILNGDDKIGIIKGDDLSYSGATDDPWYPEDMYEYYYEDYNGSRYQFKNIKFVNKGALFTEINKLNTDAVGDTKEQMFAVYNDPEEKDAEILILNWNSTYTDFDIEHAESIKGVLASSDSKKIVDIKIQKQKYYSSEAGEFMHTLVFMVELEDTTDGSTNYRFFQYAPDFSGNISSLNLNDMTLAESMEEIAKFANAIIKEEPTYEGDSGLVQYGFKLQGRSKGRIVHNIEKYIDKWKHKDYGKQYKAFSVDYGTDNNINLALKLDAFGYSAGDYTYADYNKFESKNLSLQLVTSRIYAKAILKNWLAYWVKYRQQHEMNISLLPENRFGDADDGLNILDYVQFYDYGSGQFGPQIVKIDWRLEKHIAKIKVIERPKRAMLKNAAFKEITDD